MQESTHAATEPRTTGASSDATPDGPTGLPFVGSVRPFARDPLEFVTRTAREYGPVSYYELGTYSVYQLSDPDLVRHVLVDRNERYVKGDLFDRTLEPVLGRGLLTSEGSFWREHRHRLQPAFHPDQIADAAATMTTYASDVAAEWTDGEARDVHADMMRLTVEVVADALFDADIRESEADIGRALTVVMDVVSDRMGYPVEVPSWLPTRNNRRFRRAVETLRRVADEILADHDRSADPDEGDVVSLLVDGQAGAVDDHAGSGASGNGVTGVHDGGLPREQARDEIVTILLAGHETTALALTYAFHVLGRYPDVERRLGAELDDVLGGRPPTVEDLGDLTYTERVVKESMRLYPPVWELVREPVVNDVVGGYRIPTGETVSMHQWVLHRDPDLYDDPLAFRPDRWTEEMEASLPPYAYFPFGGGPRRCIGDRFAMLEARLVLATIAQEWRFEPLDDLSFSPSITLRPDGPVEMVTHRR